MSNRSSYKIGNFPIIRKVLRLTCNLDRGQDLICAPGIGVHYIHHGDTCEIGGHHTIGKNDRIGLYQSNVIGVDPDGSNSRQAYTCHQRSSHTAYSIDFDYRVLNIQ